MQRSHRRHERYRLAGGTEARDGAAEHRKITGYENASSHVHPLWSRRGRELSTGFNIRD